MFSKPLAFGLLALGCVTAAAGGAYVATRHNLAQAQATTSPAAATTTSSTAVPADKSVPSTDAAVTPPALEATPIQAAQTAPVDQPKASPDTRRIVSNPPAVPKTREQKPAGSSKRVEVVAKNQPARTVPLPDPVPGVAAQPSVPPAAVASAAETAIVPPAAPDAAHSESVDTPRPAQFEELVLPAASVIGLQVETGLTSERSRVEDRVEARVTRDVLVDGRLAIAAGSRMLGSVTQVDRGGKVKERARLAIRFHTLVLGNGDEVAVRTEPITREGDAPAADSSKKIGGAAVGGAILGAILGGGKGAMIGGMAGAGGGTAMVMAGDRNPATFQAGTIVTARLSAPATIQVQREQ